MQRLIIVIVFFTVVAILLPITTVIAQDETRFDHTINFKIGGLITIDRQLGHDCTTGAVKSQTVRGYGEMTKQEHVKIAQHIMSVEETSDWSVPAGAMQGLTVTTNIKLCSRPMSAAAETYSSPAFTIYQDEIINIYHPAVVKGDVKINRLTEQIWAAQVTTNPGNSGSYHADFVAAYGPGPYERKYGVEDKFGNIIFYEEGFMWDFSAETKYFERDHKAYGYPRGKYYVGNYFNIEQYAHTTGGALKRFISISNPFEGAILVEELDVLGRASVREAFKMHGLERGPRGVTLSWYELF